MIYYHETREDPARYQSAYIPYLHFIGKHLARNMRMALPALDNVAGSVKASVNRGRWLIDCPTSCGGAVMASNEVNLFICPWCGNVENNGSYYAVEFPRTRKAIEYELLKRPETNQNWKPGETVKILRAENAEHGVDSTD